MNLFISKNLERTIQNLRNEELKNKIISIFNTFNSEFKSPNNFDNKNIKKLHWTNTNLFIYRIDRIYRLIFTAEVNENGTTTVFLDLVKHGEYEQNIDRWKKLTISNDT